MKKVRVYRVEVKICNDCPYFFAHESDRRLLDPADSFCLNPAVGDPDGRFVKISENGTIANIPDWCPLEVVLEYKEKGE